MDLEIFRNFSVRDLLENSLDKGMRAWEDLSLEGQLGNGEKNEC